MADAHAPTGRDYYAGKTILLTGATGLVGKALIEAVLRRSPRSDASTSSCARAPTRSAAA
jgi:uncharacterized protein YbjT (DUF2867 family)